MKTKLETYYAKYSATKEAYAFVFSWLCKSTDAARVNRLITRLCGKALPSTVDATEWMQGIPVSWFTGPPTLFDYS